MFQTKLLDEKQIVEKLLARPRLAGPFLVYSSLIQGWTASPLGLVVSLDDHGFHRGDGVFEAARVAHRKAYLLKEHFERMQRSMAHIDLHSDMNFDSLYKIVHEGIQHFCDQVGENDAVLRMYCTRGPGGFAADIRESLGSQFFIVLSKYKPQAPERHTVGVRIGRSHVPVKHGWMANAKTLNYLPNVMMKKESVERGLDFTVAFDERGCLAESATENLVVLRADGVLAHPKFDRILRGCTMLRLFDLVERENLVPTARGVDIHEDDILNARGAYIMNSTFDLLPVCEYEGKPIPVGPHAAQFLELIRKDQ